MTDPSRKRFRTCILHIGTEKTGSTTIQARLERNRRPLRGQGILYPSSVNADAHTSQWAFVAAVHPKAWEMDTGRSFGVKTPADQAPFRAHLAGQLEREFNRAPNAETLLISSEHFHSRLTHIRHIEALKAFLDPWVEAYRIVVYFRRQDRMAISAQSTIIKSGNGGKDAFQLKPIKAPLSPYHFHELYQRWSSVFGEAAILARLYPEKATSNDEIIRDFEAATGCVLSRRSRIARYNPSLDRKTFQFVAAFNRQIPNEVAGRQDLDRKAFIGRLSELSPGKFYFVSRAEAEAFYAPFRDANEALRKLAFPDRSAPLFDEDFSEYPEEVVGKAPQYDEAVAIAYALWKLERAKNPLRLLQSALRRGFGRRR